MSWKHLGNLICLNDFWCSSDELCKQTWQTMAILFETYCGVQPVSQYKLIGKERTVYLYNHRLCDPLAPYSNERMLNHFAFLIPCEFDKSHNKKNAMEIWIVSTKILTNCEHNWIKRCNVNTSLLNESFHIHRNKQEINVTKDILILRQTSDQSSNIIE